MSARLFCKYGPLAGAHCEIDEEATIGSDSANSLVLNSPSIAETHARIRLDRETGCYILEDLGGAGIALDGVAIEGSTRLDRLHVITLAGEHDFFFQGSETRRPSPDDSQPQPPESAGSQGSPGETTLFRQRPSLAAPPSFKAAEPSPGAASHAAQEHPDPIAARTDQPGERTMYGSMQGIAAPPQFEPSQSSPQRQAGSSGPQERSSEPQTLYKPSARISPPPSFESPSSAQSSTSDEEKPPPRPERISKYELELDTKQGRKAYPLREGDNAIGRAPSCQVSVNDLTLSRRHAVLTVASERVHVRDLGSTNKTYVDGQEIEAEVQVSPDAPLRFGKLEGRIRCQEP